MKNKGGIYMILNTYNNKCYIGSTNNFNRRKNEHFNALRNNKHHSQHLQKSFNKYGEDKFVFIILEKVTKEELTNREIFWVNFKKSLDSKYGYNIGIPQKNDLLEIRNETKLKLLLATHKQFYSDGRISLQDFLNGKRYKDLYVKKGVPNKEKIFAFNKITGIKELEFESISKTAKHFNCIDKRISEVCNGHKKSYKGYIFVKEKDYDPNIEYKKVYKNK